MSTETAMSMLFDRIGRHTPSPTQAVRRTNLTNMNLTLPMLCPVILLSHARVQTLSTMSFTVFHDADHTSSPREVSPDSIANLRAVLALVLALENRT
jgi:hypothetical protein